MLSLNQSSGIQGLSSFTATFCVHFILFTILFDHQNIDRDVLTVIVYLVTALVNIFTIYAYCVTQPSLMKFSFYSSIALTLIWIIFTIIYLYYGEQNMEIIGQSPHLAYRDKRLCGVHAFMFCGLSIAQVICQHSVGIFSAQNTD